jgi:hypothetical protein
MHSVGTTGIPEAPPRGRRCTVPAAHETHVTGAMTTVKDAVSVPKGMSKRRLEAPCVTLVSRGIFECQATSPSTMAKPSLESGWRTTALCAERAEQMTTSLSSSSSQSIYQIPLEPGWTISREMSSIVGMTFRGSSSATSRARTCVLASPRI